MAISKITANSVNLTSIGRDDDANTSIDFDGSDVIAINTGGSEALRIDSSQRVLIGHTSTVIGLPLEVFGTNFGIVRNTNNASGAGAAHYKSRGNVSSPTVVSNGDNTAAWTSYAYDGSSYVANAQMRFEVDGNPGTNDMPGRIEFLTTADGQSSPAERMRIDSSGNLLVGTTNTSPSDLSSGEGIRFGSGQIESANANGYVAKFNRTGSDGGIVEFNKDGTTVGFIENRGGTINLITDNSSATGAGIGGTNASILPCQKTGIADNLIDMGASNFRWDDIYATNGTIQTSDRNEKQDIEELSEAEQRVAVAAKALMRKFRWIDAVEKKGDDARIHFGVIAQDLQAAFEAEGLDANRYAMFCSNTWWEAEGAYTDDEGVEQTRINTYDTADEAPQGATERTRLGVRYPELLAFIIAAI